MGIMPAKFLSWNAARLLALMLNALSGLVQFLQKEPPENLANLDAMLALRMIQENLLALDGNFRGQGFHHGIFQGIRNLSSQIDELRGKNLAGKNEFIRKFEPILTPNPGFKFGEHKLLDERLRWAEKEQDGRAKNAEIEEEKIEQLWMENGGENSLQRCILAIITNCTLPPNCLPDEFLHSKGQIGFELTRQVLLFRLIFIDGQAKKCSKNRTLMNGEEKDAFLNEKCTNMWDEMNAVVQGRPGKKKQLARIQLRTLGLLAEQAFLCGHQGFVQFGNPHLLLALLSWQHPEFGCWAARKADPVPDFGMKAAVEFEHLRGDKRAENENESRIEDECLVHTSLLMGLAISGLFLRLLLDPGPWPEQHGLSEAQFDGVMAEDKFRAFPYLEWVRDSEIGPVDQGIRLLRPPQSSWSPDLLAFVCLLFVIVLAFVIFIHFCGDEGPPGRPRKGGPGHKKMYPYAFKKL